MLKPSIIKIRANIRLATIAVSIFLFNILVLCLLFLVVEQVNRFSVLTNRSPEIQFQTNLHMIKSYLID